MPSSASRAVANDSSDAVRAFTALRRIVQALRTSARDADRAPLVTNAQLLVLRELGGAPGMSLGELARRTHTTQSTVSEVVTRLVEAGLIRRRVAAEDARRRELSLTARGRGVVERAPESMLERLQAAFERLPAARQRAVSAGLEGWLAAAGLDAEEPDLTLAADESAGGRRSRIVTGGGHGSRRPG